MKKLLLVLAISIVLVSCSAVRRGSMAGGEVTGVGASSFSEPTPYGMVLVELCLYIVEHRGSCGGEPRHRLEEGIGDDGPRTGHVVGLDLAEKAAEEVGQGTEDAERDPGERDDDEGVAPTHRRRGIVARTEQGEACRTGDEG